MGSSASLESVWMCGACVSCPRACALHRPVRTIHSVGARHVGGEPHEGAPRTALFGRCMLHGAVSSRVRAPHSWSWMGCAGVSCPSLVARRRAQSFADLGRQTIATLGLATGRVVSAATVASAADVLQVRPLLCARSCYAPRGWWGSTRQQLTSLHARVGTAHVRQQCQWRGAC
jgi:hypothetical protein